MKGVSSYLNSKSYPIDHGTFNVSLLLFCFIKNAAVGYHPAIHQEAKDATWEEAAAKILLAAAVSSAGGVVMAPGSYTLQNKWCQWASSFL